MCEGMPVCVAVERMRPANNDQLLAYHHLHEHFDLLPQEEQWSYVTLQRSEKPTIGKRKKRECDEDSEGSKTDPGMPDLSDKEESDNDNSRKVYLVDDESDDGEPEQEVEDPKPTPIVKRSPERDPSEGRSPQSQKFSRGRQFTRTEND